MYEQMHLMIRVRQEHLPANWELARTPRIFTETSLRERLALAVGRWLIAAGEKLVRLAAVPPRLEQETV